MDYQEAIEIIQYASAFNSENSRLTKALDVAVSAMQELQALNDQGLSMERLKDINFRDRVIEHINYKNYLSVKDDLEDYQQIGTLEEVVEYKRFYEDIAPKTEDELIDLVEYRKIGTLKDIREAVEKQKECEHCGYKIHSKIISKLNSCNDCGLVNTCVKRPEYGDYCRINCYDWRS